jgi:hypothetical protein
VSLPGDDEQAPESLAQLAEALRDVRRESGVETIELRARLRAIEQRLQALEEQHAQLETTLGELASAPSPPADRPPPRREEKRTYTPEEIERKRAAKREARIAQGLAPSASAESDSGQSEPVS